MPALDKFPASQQVTFKYYEGVLAFLEENYVEVRRPRVQHGRDGLANTTLG